ncbi:cytochrome c oxidase assembly protein [Deinococcus taeanensis]|uniref:cytochrome c oxidase assembly protein n=1 Tax=Deinococcus taeanensis TaxID=2737050 RepID=UPI001CDC9394|nr:cytochrome c oxidase assembly protein [Deinococcus taeanensis]UBV43234.1 cytochrome c oxidase assembly protein [Deinococcus taeanensis]
MTAPVNLNPTLADLLTPHPDLLFLVPTLLAAAAYAWGYARAHRTPDGRVLWPAWKAALFAAGVIALLLTTQSRAATLTQSSMALYMGRLMLLAELVPPLMVLGLPRLPLNPQRGAGRLLNVLLDPWVALALWTAVIIFWNVPAGFNASVVSNSAAALLPGLYLLSSLLVWSVILRPLPSVQPADIGSRGWFGLLAALPMMAVASVWLYAPRVLYTPYVNALCLWNLTPLQNQQLSGWVMMLAGLPALALAFIQLFAWLVNLSESQGMPPQPPQGGARP